MAHGKLNMLPPLGPAEVSGLGMDGWSQLQAAVGEALAQPPGEAPGQAARLTRYGAVRQGGLLPVLGAAFGHADGNNTQAGHGTAVLQPSTGRPAKRRRTEKAGEDDGVGVCYLCGWEGCTYRDTRYAAVRAHYRLHQRDGLWVCGCIGCQSTNLLAGKALNDPGSPPEVLPLPRPGRPPKARPITPFKCSKKGCGASFSERRLLVLHKAEAHGAMVYACELVGCGEVFEVEYKRKRHADTHHVIPPLEHVCPHDGCGLRFDTALDLTEHSRDHVPEGAPVCTFYGCAEVAASEDELCRHRLDVHAARPYVCMAPGCGLAFGRTQELADHAAGAHGTQVDGAGEEVRTCRYHGCFKVLGSTKDLRRHLARHSGTRPYVCSVAGCGKAFALPAGLRSHEASHETGVRSAYRKGAKPAPTDRPYVCTYDGCGKAYALGAELRAHERAHTKPFSCEVCGARFRSMALVREHSNGHSNLRPFKCDVEHCGAAFNYRSNLRLHRRVHARTRQPPAAHDLPTLPSA